MSIVAMYERDEWESKGGWRGVEPYVDVVTLLFRDDDEIDDLEESGETREEIPLEEHHAVLVKVTRRRAFRTYERMDDGSWLHTDKGERDFTESIVVPRETPPTPMRPLAMADKRVWLKTKYYPVDVHKRVIYDDPQRTEGACSLTGKYRDHSTIGIPGRRLNAHPVYQTFTVAAPIARGE